MTTEENISDTMSDNTEVNDAIIVREEGNEEAGYTNIELVSDDEEEESPEEESGVVTYSCTLGHNVPCVMQALAGGEEDTRASPVPGNVSAESDQISEPVEDLITSNKCDIDDDFVAAPLTSKFVVNFTKADSCQEDKTDTEPRTETEQDDTVLTPADAEDETTPKEMAKEENLQAEKIKQKVSTKKKIFNVLFGCFKCSNKSTS